HTIVLPHAVAYNREAAPEAMARIAASLGGADPAGGLYDLAKAIGAPVALRDIGMRAESIDEAARIASEKPDPNPRAIEFAAIRRLLMDAWEGRRPRTP